MAFQLIEPCTPVEDLPQIRLMRLPTGRRLDAASVSGLIGAHEIDGNDEISVDQELELMNRWNGFAFKSRSASPDDSKLKSRGVFYSVSDHEGLLLLTSYLPRFQGVAEAAFEETHLSLIPFDSLDIFSGGAVQISKEAQRKILQAFEAPRRLYLRIWSWTATKLAKETGRSVVLETPCLDHSTDQRAVSYFDLALAGSAGSCEEGVASEEDGTPEFISVSAPLLPDHWPAPVHTTWGSGMRCELHAISWNRVELRVDERLDRKKLGSWNERWVQCQSPAGARVDGMFAARAGDLQTSATGCLRLGRGLLNHRSQRASCVAAGTRVVITQRGYMKKISFLIFSVILLLQPACSDFEGNTSKSMQEDFDRIRLDHILRISEFVREYKEISGDLPFANISDSRPVMIVIGTEKQIERHKGNLPLILDLPTRSKDGIVPEQPSSIERLSYADFKNAMEEVLKKEINVPVDPQKVPVNKPVLYVYTYYMGVYDVTAYLHNPLQFARPVAEYCYKITVGSKSAPKAAIWTPEDLVVQEGFEEFYLAPFNRDGYALKANLSKLQKEGL